MGRFRGEVSQALTDPHNNPWSVACGFTSLMMSQFWYYLSFHLHYRRLITFHFSTTSIDWEFFFLSFDVSDSPRLNWSVSYNNITLHPWTMKLSTESSNRDNTQIHAKVSHCMQWQFSIGSQCCFWLDLNVVGFWMLFPDQQHLSVS